MLCHHMLCMRTVAEHQQAGAAGSPGAQPHPPASPRLAADLALHTTQAQGVIDHKLLLTALWHALHRM